MTWCVGRLGPRFLYIALDHEHLSLAHYFMLNVFCLPPNPTPNLIHYPPCSTSQSERNLRTSSLTSYLLASIYYPGSLNTEPRHISKCFPPSKARVAFWKPYPYSYTSDPVPLGFASPCFSRLISGSVCICLCVCVCFPIGYMLIRQLCRYAQIHRPAKTKEIKHNKGRECFNSS